MTKDLTKVSDPERFERREELSAEAVGEVFRQLAQEHVIRRAGATSQVRESCAESIWARIEAAGPAISLGRPSLVGGAAFGQPSVDWLCWVMLALGSRQPLPLLPWVAPGGLLRSFISSM
jgi:hypothetical protein